MAKKLEVVIAVCFLAFLMLTTGLVLSAGGPGVPMLDEMVITVVEDLSVAVEEMKIGKFDFLGLQTDEQIASIADAGFDLHWTDAYYYGSIIIDMRDYSLECGSPSDNLPNTPLNYSNFRLALHKILGWEFWEEALAEVIGTTAFPHDTIVFSASGDYCASNDPVPLEGYPKFGGPELPFTRLVEGTVEDPGAREYLTRPLEIDPYPFPTKHTGDTAWMNPEKVGAFTIEDGKLYDPNGNVVRQMTVKYYAGDIVDITMWEDWIVPALNEAFHMLGVEEGPEGQPCPEEYPFVPVSMTWGGLVTDVAEYRDFDLAYMGWSLSHRPDWLYGLWTSAQACCWGYNDPGLGPETIGNTLSDDFLDTIYTSLNVTAVKEAVYWFQYYFLYEWCPLIIYLNSYDVVASGHGTAGEMTTPLQDVVETRGYGSGTIRTWELTNWGGNSPYDTELVNRRTYSVASELNNLIADEVVDDIVLTPIGDEGLLTIDYETLEDVPYIAKDWNITYWSWPEIGVEDGMSITYWLRDDVYWHDGYQLTSEDIAFALSMLIKYKPPPRTEVWNNLVYVEPEGPNKVSLYYNTTGVYQLFNAAAMQACMTYPKRILEKVDELYENPFLWEPNTISYEEWFPEGPKPGFEPPEGVDYTLLIGVGPYIFDYVDESIGKQRVVKNPNYWRGTLTCAIDPFGHGSEAYLYRVEPETGVAHYEVTVCNYNNENATNLELRVYEDGEQVDTVTIENVKKHGYTRFGDYTFGPFEKGTIHTILAEVYKDGVLECSYEQVVHATVKEDTNLDGKVDIMDIASAAKAFGSTAVPANPRWNPRADVDDNFQVNIMDIAAIAKKFGWPER